MWREALDDEACKGCYFSSAAAADAGVSDRKYLRRSTLLRFFAAAADKKPPTATLARSIFSLAGWPGS